jgi:hypothetical protein
MAIEPASCAEKRPRPHHSVQRGLSFAGAGRGTDSRVGRAYGRYGSRKVNDARGDAAKSPGGQPARIIRVQIGCSADGTGIASPREAMLGARRPTEHQTNSSGSGRSDGHPACSPRGQIGGVCREDDVRPDCACRARRHSICKCTDKPARSLLVFAANRHRPAARRASVGPYLPLSES